MADLLTSQSKSQDRVIEVEKILLRDASGQYRGKISANPDGSADLVLSDRAGNAWARLGVNQDGEAFLELKDKKGESSFKVAVGAPSPGAGAGPAATPADAPIPAASQPLESPGVSPQPIMPAAAEGEPLGESGSVPPPPTPDQDLQPGGDVNSGVVDRLEKLAASESASENLLGQLSWGCWGDPGHPGLCALSTPSPGLARRGPRGARPKRPHPGLAGR